MDPGLQEEVDAMALAVPYRRVMVPVPLSEPQEPEEVQPDTVSVEASAEKNPLAVTLLPVFGSA